MTDHGTKKTRMDDFGARIGVLMQSGKVDRNAYRLGCAMARLEAAPEPLTDAAEAEIALVDVVIRTFEFENIKQGSRGG